jgi:uncharacterized Rmd1/YagE family protein
MLRILTRFTYNTARFLAQETSKKKKGLRDIKADDIRIPYAHGALGPLENKQVIAFSLASSFSPILDKVLAEKYSLLPFMTDDVISVKLGSSSVDFDDPEAYIFKNSGTFCTWGATAEQIQSLKDTLKPLEVESYSSVESEDFEYIVDLSQSGGMLNDVIILGQDLPLQQSKLVYSSGISRSVKLACLETLLNQHLDKNKHIPQILLLGKKLPVDRATILKNLGELFNLRCIST